eukprot:m51a1_g1150 hypothetical protein (455) ;mRNA; r:292990-294620
MSAPVGVARKPPRWKCVCCGAANSSADPACTECGVGRLGRTGRMVTAHSREPSTTVRLAGRGTSTGTMAMSMMGPTESPVQVRASGSQEITIEDEESWICAFCDSINPSSTDICAHCNEERLKTVKINNTGDETALLWKRPGGSEDDAPLQRWQCPNCEAVNAANAKFCSECNMTRPGSGDRPKTGGNRTAAADDKGDPIRKANAMLSAIEGARSGVVLPRPEGGWQAACMLGDLWTADRMLLIGTELLAVHSEVLLRNERLRQLLYAEGPKRAIRVAFPDDSAALDVLRFLYERTPDSIHLTDRRFAGVVRNVEFLGEASLSVQRHVCQYAAQRFKLLSLNYASGLPSWLIDGVAQALPPAAAFEFVGMWMRGCPEDSVQAYHQARRALRQLDVAAMGDSFPALRTLFPEALQCLSPAALISFYEKKLSSRSGTAIAETANAATCPDQAQGKH